MPGATKVAARKPVGFSTPERASANFTLKFGLVTIPVSVKPLLESLKTKVSGTTLCLEHMEKVSQRYICGEGSDHEHLLTKGECGLGYETEKKSGQYVVLDDGVIDEIVLERTGDLEIERLAPVSTIDPTFFEKPYLVWPQSAAAATAFDLLAALLRRENRAAVVRGVMNKRTRTLVFMWSAYHETLVAFICAYTSQVRERDIELARRGLAERGDPDPKMIDAAMPILASLDGDFDPQDNEDEYTPLMLQAIADAAAGKKPTPVRKTDAKPATDDLLAALQASVAAAPPKEKAAKKAAPKKTAARKTASKTRA